MSASRSRLPHALRAALAVASLWAPRRHRARWRREWIAELTCELDRHRDRTGGPGLVRLAVGTFVGALADARALHHLDGPRRADRSLNDGMTTMGRTMLHAARSLLRAPGFSLAGALTLTLGLGATSAMFAVVDHVLLRPFPYPDADEVVQVRHPVPGMPEQEPWGMSVAGYFHFQERAQSFAELGAWNGISATLTGGATPERLPAAMVTASLLRLLGAEAVHGRLFSEEDDEPEAAAVVLLGQRLWETRFGADPGIVGRSLEVDGGSVEVVGVVATDFGLPDYDADLWRPWQLDRAAEAVNSHYVAALARLRDGVTVEDARREMVALTAELPERFPRAYGGDFMERFGFTADVETLRSAILGDAERPLWVLLGAVGLVLVLACANVANLFLVRTEGRAREVAVRRALGASNRDLSAHFLSESVIVASLAAAAGVALSAPLLPVLRSLAPDTLPRMDAIAVDARTMLFAAAAALIAALVLGGLPILRHAGTAPSSALGEGSRGNAASARGGLRRLLVVAQMALAVVLLAGAGLMLRTAAALRSVDPGFEPEGAVALDFVLPWWEYSTVEQTWGFTSGLLANVRSLPGVQAAGITNRIPMDGPAGCWAVALEDRPEEPCPVMRFVSDGYFAAMGIPVIEGREYEPTDDELRTGSAVVSRSVAESYWDGAFLGRGIRIYGSGPPYHRVVGVVGDVREQGLTEPAPGTVYFPYRAIEGESQWGPMRDGILVVRARPGTAVTSLVPQVREAFRTVDAGVAITAVRGIDEVVARSMARTTFTMLLLVLAAGIALVLGAVGLYGVVSYAVSRRRSEIGIRMALGAARQRVARMVLHESLRMIVPGALLGLVAALISGRVLRSLLFGVEPTDPITLLGVALVLTAVAAVAAWLPARRAAAVDPAVSLRAE